MGGFVNILITGLLAMAATAEPFFSIILWCITVLAISACITFLIFAIRKKKIYLWTISFSALAVAICIGTLMLLMNSVLSIGKEAPLQQICITYCIPIAYALLLIPQILLLVFAAVKKSDYLWGILFHCIAVSMIVAFCAGWYAYEVDLWHMIELPIRPNILALMAGMTYAAVFLASLITRTALAREMGYKKIYTSLWITYCNVVLVCIGIFFLRVI